MCSCSKTIVFEFFNFCSIRIGNNSIKTIEIELYILHLFYYLCNCFNLIPNHCRFLIILYGCYFFTGSSIHL